jgi:hypothetical protein
MVEIVFQAGAAILMLPDRLPLGMLQEVPYLTRVLWRTQKMMKPEAYLREYETTKAVPVRISASAAIPS